MNKRLYTAIGAIVTIGVLATGYELGNYPTGVAAAGQTQSSAQTTTITAAQRSVASFAPTQEILADLYDRISPSVVNIQVTVPMQASMGNPFNGQPFPSPFGQAPDGSIPQPGPAHGEGSGFVYDTQGHIITNNHVVADADPENIIVNFPNGHWAKAALVARDPQADLAILKVNGPEDTPLVPLTLAAEDGLRVGYYVAAIGSPFGLDETLTLGVVSGLERAMPTSSAGQGAPVYSLPDVIQTDTAINPGNSGGPLLNMKGEVVGINFMIESPGGANAGVGFAIPVSVIKKIAPALIKDGSFAYAYLGLSGQSINAPVAEEHHLSDNTLGVYVGDVAKDGPAGQAGLQADDIIKAIGDQPVDRFEDLLSYLFNNGAPEQQITLHILRDGKAMTLDVTLAERPAAPTSVDEQAPKAAVTVADAIQRAKQAVIDAGLVDKIDSANATQEEQDGRQVWVVTLSGGEKSATVTLDAQTGETLSLNVK